MEKKRWNKVEGEKKEERWWVDGGSFLKVGGRCVGGSSCLVIYI